jgi:hypothetical protein
MELPTTVFHLAEAANWISIQRLGLLSTSALLDLAGIQGKERDRFEGQHRPAHTELPNGVQIRDQKPMFPLALTRSLIGMIPEEWYRLLNSKVFFWLDPARVDRQRKACEPRPQVVLVVDTQKLLAQYDQKVTLSPINTGNARRRPALRGRGTFVPYGVWMESAWSSEAAGLHRRARARSHRPIELTVHDAVPDIMNMVVQVWPLGPGESFRERASSER